MTRIALRVLQGCKNRAGQNRHSLTFMTPLMGQVLVRPSVIFKQVSLQAGHPTRTKESPRKILLHPHEDDTCSVTPCTAMQGQTSVSFLKSFSEPPLGNGIPVLSSRAGTTGSQPKNANTNMTLGLTTQVHPGEAVCVLATSAQDVAACLRQMQDPVNCAAFLSHSGAHPFDYKVADENVHTVLLRSCLSCPASYMSST